MTEQIPSRRQSDQKLDALIAKVDDVIKKQERHLLDYHGDLKVGEATVMVGEHRELVRVTADNQKLLTRIVEVLEGKDVMGLNGQIIRREPGIRYQVDKLVKSEGNGGLKAKIKLSKGQWAAITAIIGMLTVLISGVIDLIGKVIP